MRSQEPQRRTPQSGLLGLAFDAKDEQKRITRGPNFLLLGGSPETHGQMQETATKINEHLDRQGKQLRDVSAQEFCEIVDQVRR